MKSVGIIANPSKKDALSLTKKVLPLLASQNANVLLDPWLSQQCGMHTKPLERKEIYARSDVLMVLGGDGTMLSVAGELNGKATPLLGINLGSLGFLTEISSAELPAFLPKMFRGEYRTEKREALEATVTRAGKDIASHRAVNDVVLGKGALSRVMRFDLRVEGEHLRRVVADALIVATPTGSTAHALSAGGPIVHPSVPAFVVTAVCPQSLAHRPLVLPMDKKIEIEVQSSNEDMALTFDGQRAIPLLQGDIVSVRQSDKPFHLLLKKDTGYFDALKDKLPGSEP